MNTALIREQLRSGRKALITASALASAGLVAAAARTSEPSSPKSRTSAKV